MKTCSRCREAKPLDQFSRLAKSPDGLQPVCRSCAKEVRQAWYANNKDRVKEYNRSWREANRERHRSTSAAWRERNRDSIRERQLLRVYSIDLNTFNRILESQDGVCGLCKRPDPGGSGTWHIDHDHTCCPGKGSCGDCIRGLLCVNCNPLLGHYEALPEEARTWPDANAYLLATVK